MSPNPLKRERDEEYDPESITRVENPFKESIQPIPTPLIAPISSQQDSSPSIATAFKRESSLARSISESLSDAGTTTPSFPPNSPTTAFSALNGVPAPPKKRVKLTFAEKEEKRILREIKDVEKAEERARKDIERREREYEKLRRDSEKEVERKKKDAEREEKRLQKGAKEAEKEKERKAKEEEKRRKEEEKIKLEEDKKKKERLQPTLAAFFGAPKGASREDFTMVKATSPTPSTCPETLKPKSPNKREDGSAYEKTFLSFYIQDNVSLAPISRFERDERASELLHQNIDKYIGGEFSVLELETFDASRLFNTPVRYLTVRGRRCTPVRELMAQTLGGARQPIDLTTESQNAQIRQTRHLLKAVPYKFLSFQEDVRPPYIGTYSSAPVSGTRKLARNPMKRDLPQVDYDYDSEAEWEAPGDDEEDIGSEGEEDEDIDGEEDLDGFLDDAEDITVNARRLVMQADLEPKSTGLCWEDHMRRGPISKMSRYHMEIIHENLQIQTPIEPFSTRYWDRPRESSKKSMEPPRIPLNPIKGTSAGFNGPNPKPVKVFGISDISKPVAHPSTASKPPKKVVAAEDMLAFKDAVQGSELSKLGLIEVLNKQFSKISKASIKFTLETHAKRIGAKEADKRWIWVGDELDRAG